MTVPVHTAPGKVWWLVTNHTTRVLVPATPNADPDRVIRQALRAMGHTPTLQTMDPEGNWSTPTGPIPAMAFTRRVYPHHLTAACTARHATQADVDLHYQHPQETPR
jgi:hypothetical protein